MEIVLATRNRKKIEEIRRMTADVPVTIFSLADYPHCPETVEDRATFEGNATKKAVEVCQCTGKIALADDSGLEVDALKGAPGVYSARYAGTDANDIRNNEKVLAELKAVPTDKRTARFVCCMALAFPDGSVKTFFGFVQGRITLESKGKTGFGYDPVFLPDGFDRTFAEMAGPEKDKLSHRGKAIEKFVNFLRTPSHL
jgi:XTP/dITP diphosphohydrolase